MNKNKNTHVELVLSREFPKPNLYKAGAPQFDKHASSRQELPIVTRNPHEVLEEDYTDFNEVQGSDDGVSKAWWNVFDAHPVVKQARERCIHWSRIIPVALYWDGIMYTKNESSTCFYVHNLRTLKKYLFAVVRLGLSLHKHGNISEHKPSSNSDLRFACSCVIL